MPNPEQKIKTRQTPPKGAYLKESSPQTPKQRPAGRGLKLKALAFNTLLSSQKTDTTNKDPEPTRPPPGQPFKLTRFEWFVKPCSHLAHYIPYRDRRTALSGLWWFPRGRPPPGVPHPVRADPSRVTPPRMRSERFLLRGLPWGRPPYGVPHPLGAKSRLDDHRNSVKP